MAHSDPTAFFVYGTLMHGQANFDACAADVLTATPATLTGSLYHLSAGYPVMFDTEDGTVVGEIMTFPDPARTLTVFDELEGVDPAAPERGFYMRVVRKAQPVDGGPPVRCWTYLARPEQLGRVQPYATPVPAGDWAAFLRKEMAS